VSFLPGHFPAAVLEDAEVAPLTTLTQVASNTSIASTITGPAGIVAGDLLVYFDNARGSSGAPTTVTPSGFSLVATNTIGNDRQNISIKIATGAEANAAIAGMNGTDSNQKLMYVFRGDVPILAANASTPNGEATNGNPSDQNVLSSAGVVPLVVIAGYGSESGIDPRTFTPTKDGEINVTSNNDAWLAYKIYNSSPADVNVDMTDEGNGNIIQSFYVACS
jgi:hypothetical protein